MAVSSLTRRHGVVGAITPWNVPLYVNIGKVIAALLAGCTVVLKPAPDTPLMGSIMGELAIEAGLPRGVFNVVLDDAANFAQTVMGSLVVFHAGQGCAPIRRACWCPRVVTPRP